MAWERGTAFFKLCGVYRIAKICATAVASLMAFGLLVVVSEIERENVENLSGEAPDVSNFMQLTEHRHIRAEHSCPEELLHEFPDCTVVSFRAGFQLGPSGIHPEPGEDSVVALKALETPGLPDGQRTVLGWKPVVQKTPSSCPGKEGELVHLVHHMNGYMYEGRSVQPGRWYNNDDREIQLLQGHGRSDDDKATMVTSHDRLAGTYVLPQGHGIPANDPITLEYHFLFPKCWDHQKKSILENSGMDLYMSSKAPRIPAALIGALDMNAFVQPNQGTVDVVTSFDSKRLKKFFWPTLPESTSFLSSPDMKSTLEKDAPEIVAVHLHTHDLTQSKFFEVKDPDGSLLFRSDEEKAGYGLKEQSFANIADLGWPRLKILPGRTFSQHCRMNTDHLDHVVPYGLDWGEEMCAPLIIIRKPQKIGNLPTLVSFANSEISLITRFRRMLKSFFSHVASDAVRLAAGP